MVSDIPKTVTCFHPFTRDICMCERIPTKVRAEAVIDCVYPLVSLVRRLAGNVVREVHWRVADTITD